MNLISSALHIANVNLTGKTDKAGKPLILHALRVGLSFEDEYRIALGFLHDVPEKSGISPLEIDISINRKETDLTYYLTLLTRKSNEKYFDYISRIKDSGSENATFVKLADLYDNMDPKRLALLESDQAQFLLNRYIKARIILES